MTMTTRLPSENSDPMISTPMQRLLNPLSAAFFSVCNFILCLLNLRPSRIQLENDALLEQLKSLDAVMTQEIQNETELKQVNYTLKETITILETKRTKMETVLEEEALRFGKGQDMIVELSERTRTLKKELQILEKKNDELQTQVNTQTLLMDTKKKEWMLVADEHSQKKDSLQKKLNKQYQIEEKHAWHIIAWETGLEQSQEVAKRLRSEKNKLKKSLAILKQENIQLKDTYNSLESENSHRIAGIEI